MSNSSEPVLVSACLLGVPCRYDGSSKPNKEAQQLARRTSVVPFCPETLGGLRSPRMPSEIQGPNGEAVLDEYARVTDKEGLDVTAQFLRGAEKSVKLAKSLGAKRALLKSNSPSCGVTHIYDGTFSDTLKEGAGVAASALMRAGLEVREAKDDVKGE